MSAFGKRESKMEKVSLLFQTEIFIKGIGSQGKCMEEVFTAVLWAKNCKEFGNMEI
jgi:hypothetical protein